MCCCTASQAALQWRLLRNAGSEIDQALINNNQLGGNMKPGQGLGCWTCRSVKGTQCCPRSPACPRYPRKPSQWDHNWYVDTGCPPLPSPFLIQAIQQMLELGVRVMKGSFGSFLDSEARLLPAYIVGRMARPGCSVPVRGMLCFSRPPMASAASDRLLQATFKVAKLRNSVCLVSSLLPAITSDAVLPAYQ